MIPHVAVAAITVRSVEATGVPFGEPRAPTHVDVFLGANVLEPPAQRPAVVREATGPGQNGDDWAPAAEMEHDVAALDRILPRRPGRQDVGGALAEQAEVATRPADFVLDVDTDALVRCESNRPEVHDLR